MTPLRAEAGLSEDQIQRLIADHPAVLGGESDGAGRWFSLRRDVAAGPPGVDQWSSRHLFLNGDAVPTIVEVRRAADVSADGDIFGRAVLYAANARVWWPLDVLTASFAETYVKPNSGASQALRCLVGDLRGPGGLASGADAFWRRVGDNLAAARLRMVLVVEQVQPELARIAEFLRDQLRDAEVWILEFRQHGGASGRVLQTRIVGRRPLPASSPAPETAIAAWTRSAAATVNNTEDSWVTGLRQRCEGDEAGALDELLRWMREQYGATFVSGPPPRAYRLSVKEAGRDRFPFAIDESKAAAIHLGSLSATVAYGSEEARRGLVEELAAAGLAHGDVDLAGDLRIPLKALAAPVARSRLLGVLDGVLENLRLREAPSVFSR